MELETYYFVCPLCFETMLGYYKGGTSLVFNCSECSVILSVRYEELKKEIEWQEFINGFNYTHILRKPNDNVCLTH